MSNKKNKTSDEEFDPEKHKEIEHGPLISEHKNQYGTSDKEYTERKLAEKVPHKKEKD